MPLLRPTAFPAISFPAVVPSPLLWHRRFGHLGHDATRAALTQDYVQGVVYQGPFERDHCIVCIIGKSPQHSYTHHGHRASQIGELLHMDLCGPYPTQGPHGENHFLVILDDFSNMGFTFCLRRKNDAFSHYERTEAFIEHSTGCKVKAIRVDGALELTAGKMGIHLVSHGIAIQKTTPYAHPQAGKIERYVRTIEEGGQTLLAASSLPMSFWCDAVLTSQYLHNRLPTSTLATNITPFEVFTSSKPDVSHFCVWGCQCFVAIPNELRDKAGFKRFEAIFVGYKEHCVGWRVRDLKGKFHFSCDVIFNEDFSGRLGTPCSPLSSNSPSLDVSSSAVSPHPIRLCTWMLVGRVYDDILNLKESRRVECERKRMPAPVIALEDVVGGVGAAVGDVVVMNGGVDVPAGGVGAVDVVATAAFAVSGDLSPSFDAIYHLLAFFAPSSFPDSFSVDTDSLAAYSFHHSPFIDLTKAPTSYIEAVSRLDASAWKAAMVREERSLEEMGAFEEVELPPGQPTVTLIWVLLRHSFYFYFYFEHLNFT